MNLVIFKNKKTNEITITFSFVYAKQLVEDHILDFGYDVVENSNPNEPKKLKIMKWYKIQWNKKLWIFEIEVDTTGEWKKIDVVTAKQLSEI